MKHLLKCYQWSYQLFLNYGRNPGKSTYAFILVQFSPVPAAANPQKRKPDETSDLPVIPKSKKIRIDEGNLLTTTSDSLRLLWDADNYSCAYDALFTVLLSIYFYKPSVWKERFRNLNRTMGVLATKKE